MERTMRIVDRATFLALPVGTLYRKYGQAGKPEVVNFDDLEIKDDTTGNDWYAQDLRPYTEKATDSGEWVDWVVRLVAGEESGPLDFETICRDGLYDDEQLFAVYDRADHEALINRLMQAFRDAHGVPA
jgi:hypothetical protein